MRKGRLALARVALAGLLVALALPSHAQLPPQPVPQALAVGSEREPAGLPHAALGQWGWRIAHVDAAWDRQRGSPDVIVATIDTGVDRGHPDLAAALLPGATFVSAPSAVCPENDDGQDDNSHGTHVAGIIAALGQDGVGISGVAVGVRILPVKALDCAGFGMTSDIARGIVWATDHGARIINVSLGSAVDAPVLDAAVRYALDRNVLVVAAAGNCGASGGRCQVPDRPEYPAALSGVLAVGASDVTDALASFSTGGPQVALTAPGVRIVSTTPRYATYGSSRGGLLGHDTFSGTSQASAFVAGVAALVWSADPALSAREVFDQLTASADDLGPSGRDNAFGFGRVNALRAVQRAQTARMRGTEFLALRPHP